MPQNVGIYSDSVLFNITMSNKVSKEAKDKCRLVLERLGCDFFGDLRSADLAGIRLGVNGTILSGGQKQLIGIARALYRNPAFLY